MTVIIFLIVLAVLIFVHELGHFIFARLNGIRVDAFKLGFGPKIFSWKKGETEYGLNLIPFGGFVKIHGENPDADSESGPDSGRSFVNKNRARQASVLVAGVLFNFLFAWLLYMIVFIGGVTATTDGFEKYQSNFQNERIMITQVQSGSPAEKAGISIGDTIVSVKDGLAIISSKIPISGPIEDIQKIINESAGKTITFEYKHNGELKMTEIIPTTGIVEGKYAIGIAMSQVGDLQLPFFTAIYEGGHYTLVMLRDTAVGLYNFVASIFRGNANFSDVSGPIGIAGIVGGAAEMGFRYLLMITALISINLGIINLVPFPALDGGRLLFVGIESITRRRISSKFANIVNMVGFILLMALMVFVTFKDVLKLIG